MSGNRFANTEIELASGAYLDVLAPSPTMSLDDIAHGLANCCRFAGQCSRFYSVAEHACVVADKLRSEGRSPRIVLLGLHHDDAEAFLGDVTRPLKSLLPGYRDLEVHMRLTIEKALGLPISTGGEDEIIKAADDWALAQEARAFMRSEGATWFCADLIDSRHVASQLPSGWTPILARREWLAWDYSLRDLRTAVRSPISRETL